MLNSSTTMHTKKVFVLTIDVCILLTTTSTLILGYQIAEAAAEQQQEKFFMIMKLHKPTNSDFYQVSNITTNMKNFNQGNNKVEYSLADVTVDIDDSGIVWSLPFKIIDTTSTPNAIKTRNGSIGLNAITLDYEKQYNTLTKITTTYTGKSVLFIDNGGGQERITDLSLKAVIYPNMTGTLEMKGT